jgi:hypothetical protein
VVGTHKRPQADDDPDLTVRNRLLPKRGEGCAPLLRRRLQIEKQRPGAGRRRPACIDRLRLSQTGNTGRDGRNHGCGERDPHEHDFPQSDRRRLAQAARECASNAPADLLGAANRY